MLGTLRKIVQEVNAATDLQQALSVIVLQVKNAINCDVCSVYLLDSNSQNYVLMASDGLYLSAVGSVRLGVGDGLVSLVAENEVPVNLDDASNHERYRFFPQIGEEKYSGFLGVPIIHHRKVIGVLVVQQNLRRKFAEDEVAFLLTIGSQLSGAIVAAKTSGGIKGLSENSIVSLKPMLGLAGSPGVGVGSAVVVYPSANLETIPDKKIKDVEAEVTYFQAAVADVRRDVRAMKDKVNERLSEDTQAMFDVYLLMLESHSLTGAIVNRIQKGQWAQAALRDTIQEQIKIYQEMDDNYLRERVEDVCDLGLRILKYLQQNHDVARSYPAQFVLVGDEITATMLAEIPLNQLVGVVSVKGSVTSHIAILAHALGVPAVLGVEDFPVTQVDGREIVVDGYTGIVHISPAASIREEYLRLAQEEKELTQELAVLKDKPATTPDGTSVSLFLNAGLARDISPSLSSGAQGIGLYRTEIPFMIRDRFPGEEEQRELYRDVLSTFAPFPVTLRTLDIGGDKSLSYFPINEENPFLGWRGMRVTLDHPEIFIIQLRAMLKASIGLNNLQILLPMVGDVSEVDEALNLLVRVHGELIKSGSAIMMPKVGVMMEVPSSIYLVDLLSQRVDFFSVGTNDLTQYILAVDRNNSRVADLYDSLHPAVIRAMIQIMEGARVYEKPVCVCGEMAGDPAAALVLLGMGVDSLSMSETSLLRVKSVIRAFPTYQTSEILDEVLNLPSTVAIRKYLNQHLEQSGLGGLIRAGK